MVVMVLTRCLVVAGSDTLIGGGGADFVDGGQGSDLLSWMGQRVLQPKAVMARTRSSL